MAASSGNLYMVSCCSRLAWQTQWFAAGTRRRKAGFEAGLGGLTRHGECWNQFCVGVQLAAAAAAKPDALQPRQCSLHVDGTRDNFKNVDGARVAKFAKSVAAPADLICMRHQWR